MLAYPSFESPTIIPIITYPICPMDEYEKEARNPLFDSDSPTPVVAKPFLAYV